MKNRLGKTRTRSRRKRLEAVLAVTMRLVHETAGSMESAAERIPDNGARNFLYEMAVRRRIDRLMMEELAAGMNLGQSALVPLPDGYPHADIGRAANMDSVSRIYGVIKRQTEAYLHQLQRMYVMDESEYVRGKLGFLIRVEEDFLHALDTFFFDSEGESPATQPNTPAPHCRWKGRWGDPLVSGEAS